MLQRNGRNLNKLCSSHWNQQIWTNPVDEAGSSVSVQSCAGSWSKAPLFFVVKIQRKKYSVAALFLPRLSGNQWEQARGDTRKQWEEKVPNNPGLEWRLLLMGGLEVQGGALGSSWGHPRCPCALVQGFPGIQSFPSCPTQQEPGATGTQRCFSCSLPVTIQE